MPRTPAAPACSSPASATSCCRLQPDPAQSDERQPREHEQSGGDCSRDVGEHVVAGRLLDESGREGRCRTTQAERQIARALRLHARAYCHGHTVGGTNPSLVESLWCGNAVLAHRNRFNQWTAGAEQFFFADADECERMIERILTDDIAVARAGRMARLRAAADFVWTDILSSYERELAALGGYQLNLPKAEPVAPLPSARQA